MGQSACGGARARGAQAYELLDRHHAARREAEGRCAPQRSLGGGLLPACGGGGGAVPPGLADGGARGGVLLLRRPLRLPFRGRGAVRVPVR